MAKTVVVEKNNIKKTIAEEYKKDYIVAGWKEVSKTEKKAVDSSTPSYNYNAKI